MKAKNCNGAVQQSVPVSMDVAECIAAGSAIAETAHFPYTRDPIGCVASG